MHRSLNTPHLATADVCGVATEFLPFSLKETFVLPLIAASCTHPPPSSQVTVLYPGFVSRPPIVDPKRRKRKPDDDFYYIAFDDDEIVERCVSADFVAPMPQMHFE